jgi:hypothetical protein
LISYSNHFITIQDIFLPPYKSLVKGRSNFLARDIPKDSNPSFKTFLLFSFSIETIQEIQIHLGIQNNYRAILFASILQPVSANIFSQFFSSQVSLSGKQQTLTNRVTKK